MLIEILVGGFVSVSFVGFYKWLTSNKGTNMQNFKIDFYCNNNNTTPNKTQRNDQNIPLLSFDLKSENDGDVLSDQVYKLCKTADFADVMKECNVVQVQITREFDHQIMAVFSI